MYPTALPLARLVLIGLVTGLGLAPGHGLAQADPAASAPGTVAVAKPAAAASAARPVAPVLVICHLRVLSGSSGPAAGTASDDAAGTCQQAGAAAVASRQDGLRTLPLSEATRDARKTLTSAGGDLEITVTPESYALASQYRAAVQPAPELQLYLNGFNMDRAAVLEAQETAIKGAGVHLRFHLDGHAAAQQFWGSVYRQHGLDTRSDLHVELGWPATGPNSRIDAPVPLAVAVAPDFRRWLAVALVLAMLALMVFLIWRTNAFRDAVPAWLATAWHFQKDFDEADDAGRLAVLKRIDPDFDAKRSDAAAASVLRGVEVAPPGVPAAVPSSAVTVAGPPMLHGPAVACGLLRAGRPLPRSPYSLCRLQVGVWFAFVVATGLMLWIVYGYLPAISGSVLALLGISVGTALAAVNVEPAAAKTGSNVSQNLLLDVVTGFDQSQQLHRYQSVVVNLMLLVVGLVSVWSDLAFPVFDNTWLGFLGVSGAALAAGKQLVEKPAAETKGADAREAGQTGKDAEAAKVAKAAKAGKTDKDSPVVAATAVVDPAAPAAKAEHPKTR